MVREIGLTPIWKHNLVLILLVLCLFSSGKDVVAQEAKQSVETEYLFQDPGSEGIIFSTFYGEFAPATAFATLNNTLGKVFLMEFGFHLNRKFAIGFYLARPPNTNVVNVPVPTDPKYQDWLDAGVDLPQLPTGATQAFAYFSHSGLNLAYMHKTEKIIFFRGGFRFGRGKLILTAEKRQLLNLFSTPIFEKKVINFNPEIGVGVNLRSWWRMHLDIGYHFVFAGSEDIIDPSKFDGTTFKIGFAFGNFSN